MAIQVSTNISSVLDLAICSLARVSFAALLSRSSLYLFLKLKLNKLLFTSRKDVLGEMKVAVVCLSSFRCIMHM